MNRFDFVLCLFMAINIISCASPATGIEKAAELSEKIFLGQITSSDIREICVVKSNQKSVFPLPVLNEVENGVFIREPAFIEEFVTLLKNTDQKNDPLVSGYISSFHIYVILVSGEASYLHGAVGGNGFIVQPMYISDSISAKRNGLYNLFAANLSKRIE